MLAPSRHRPVNVTGPSGMFSLMLAPDTVYCLAIHPRDPRDSTQAYEVIRVAYLHLCGTPVMRGKGLAGLAQHALFYAARYTALARVSAREGSAAAAGRLLSPPGHRPGWSASSLGDGHQAVTRRLLATQQQQHQQPLVTGAEAASGDVVAIGAAAPDMCWFAEW